MRVVAKSLLAVAAFVGLAVAPACQPAFPGVESSQRLAITITSKNIGKPELRLPISLTTPTTFTADIQALDANGNVDKTFNGYVRLSVVPGAVMSVTGPNATGRNALLVDGVANDLQIAVEESYGNARIWVDDVGYVPADPLRVPPPQCANGIDDNHNGKTDYPVDPGCYAANDDTENGGTYAAAVSDDIYFEYPRIADVRGVNNGGVTPFNNQQVQINTEWIAPNAPGGVVVTGVASAGFYVTDLTDPRGYSSVYAYTYTAPPIMLPCDRLITFGGTGGDFFGYTELNYPTWSLEEWDPTVRPCLVPPATVFTGGDLANGAGTNGNLPLLLNLEAALVQVAASNTSTEVTTVHIGSHFGPGFVDQKTLVPTATASDCDYNGDGKIDFTAGNPEDACSTACTADLECSEFSAYLTESQFRLVVTTTNPVTKATSAGTIEGVASADADFVPTQYAGKPLGGFMGNLLYFSGGSQFTIQARCADDVVTDPTKSPLPSSKACVVARNAADQTNGN
jgi:hypothetical protein